MLSVLHGVLESATDPMSAMMERIKGGNVHLRKVNSVSYMAILSLSGFKSCCILSQPKTTPKTEKKLDMSEMANLLVSIYTIVHTVYCMRYIATCMYSICGMCHVMGVGAIILLILQFPCYFSANQCRSLNLMVN